jgi:hypothetical protein
MIAKTKRMTSVKQLNEQESWNLIEENAQRYLHMTASQFIEAWDAGRLDTERPEVMRVANLLSFVR